MSFQIDSLMRTSVQIDGKWWIARPMSDTSIFARLKDAWLVLTRKADAVTFYKQEES